MIDFEVRGRTAVVTINRPAARNAVNRDVAVGLKDAVERIEADAELWVGVLAGAGQVFCAGADLKEVAAGRLDTLYTHPGGFAGVTKLARAKPLIAAVDGPALAGGCEIVLACDLVVASTVASFGVPEVKRSLVAGAGGLIRLPRVLPRNVAIELAVTGDPLGAERAHALGLVNVLCEPGGAMAAAVELAARIGANAPVAVRLSREVLLAAAGAGEDEAWRISEAAGAAVAQTEDFAEGPRAFVDKRPPAWTGR